MATEPDEFEQIHRLNYRTFVEEIPQHPGNGEARLVDKFHHENSYAIGLEEDRVIGMVALRGNRPFSLDLKLPDLDSYLPPGHRICEIRLLAVEKGRRHGPVFRGLLLQLTEHFTRHGFTLAIISGTLRQLRLYSHLGFVPFGPVVGTGGAQFQPMHLSLEKFLRTSPVLPPLGGTGSESPSPIGPSRGLV